MSTAPLGTRSTGLPRGSRRRRLVISGATVSVIAAFSVPIAFSSSVGASPTDPTTTIATTPSTLATTSTTSRPTSTTQASVDQGVVIIGANGPGATIIATGVFGDQSIGTLGTVGTSPVLPRTGSRSTLAALAGLALLVAGAFAATFNKRRHLNAYELISSRHS